MAAPDDVSEPQSRRRRAMSQARPRTIAEAGALALLVWVTLRAVHPSHPLHDDTNEDLLLARVCAEQGECLSAGVSASMHGVQHGALWGNLLAVLRGAGWSIAAVHSFLFALSGLGVGLVFATLRRRESAHLAVPAAVLTTLGFAASDSLHVLWNPTLIPLPASMMFAMIMRVADTRRPWFVLPLIFALGLVLDTHPVAVLALPGAMLAGSAAAPNRKAAFAIAALTGVFGFGLHMYLSPGAAAQNLQTALATLTWPGAALAALAIPLLAMPFSAVIAKRSAEVRAAVCTGLVALPAFAVIGIATFTMRADGFGLRYLLPYVPAASYLAVLAGERACRWLVDRYPARLRVPWLLHGGTLIVVALAVVAWPARERHAVNLNALEGVRPHLEADGLTLDAAWARVSGPRCTQVLAAFAALGAGAAGPPERNTDSLVFAMQRDDVEGPSSFERGRWRTFETPSGTMLVGELATWVDRHRVHVCRSSRRRRASDQVAGVPREECFDADLDRGIAALLGRDEGPVPVLELEVPRLNLLPETDRGERLNVLEVSYRMPVDIPAGEGRRTILLSSAPQECHVARFVALDGIPSSTQLPSAEVILEGTSVDQHGTLTIGMDYRPCGSEPVLLFPPCISEVDDDDGPALRAVLDPSADER